MSTKPPFRRYVNELYHFNKWHDELGRFASGPSGLRSFARANRGSVYDEYLNKDGSFTEKAKGRIKTTEYDSSLKSRTSTKTTKEKQKENNNDNSNKKKGDDNSKSIRIDKRGRVHPDDAGSALSQIEQNIARDYGNKSNIYNKTAELTRQTTSLLRDTRRDKAERSAEKLDLSNMTDKEMNDYINRKSLERRYREAVSDESVRGHKAVDDFLKYGGAALSMAATVATIAATVHTLRS